MKLSRIKTVEPYMAQTNQQRRRQKLNLTVSADSRREAEQLAALEHRSISNLFEHLVAVSMKQREQQLKLHESREDPPLEGSSAQRARHGSTFQRIIKGLVTVGSSALLAFSPAQMPRSQCAHFCIPPESPMWVVLPRS